MSEQKKPPPIPESERPLAWHLERFRWHYEKGFTQQLVEAMKEILHKTPDDEDPVVPRWILDAAVEELMPLGISASRSLPRNTRRWVLVKRCLNDGYTTYDSDSRPSARPSTFEKAAELSNESLGENVGESAMRRAYYEIEKHLGLEIKKP